ncbi:MAG: transporter substrate-binding domain-containing protein [Pseudonocardiaceae bacterium]
MNAKTIASLFATGIVTTAALTSCSSPSVFNGEPIHVAVKYDQPGTGLNRGEKYSGFDIMLANYITKDLGGVTPSFTNVGSLNREAMLQSNTVQLVIATYSITPDRQEKVDFAGPYMTTNQGFLVRKSDAGWTGQDLAGKRVCTWGGTTSWAELQRYSGINPHQRTDASECVQELENGLTDAVSTDQLILYGLTQEHPDLTVIPELTLGATNYYGIGIRKGNHDDCIKIRDTLKGYITSSQWKVDFKQELPAAVNANPLDWETKFKPAPENIDLFSCQ